MHRLMLFSAFIREVSLVAAMVNLKTHNWPQCRDQVTVQYSAPASFLPKLREHHRNGMTWENEITRGYGRVP